MHITLVAFDAFNEIDLMIPYMLLNRIRRPNWKVSVCAPTLEVVSMNGLKIQAQSLLEDTESADVVIFGSGRRTREHVENQEVMARIRLSPERQLIGGQCSGTLILSRLGMLQGVPACTDVTTKPWILEEGIEVLNQPIFSKGNVATAGGCLASAYLSAWVIARTVGLEEAKSVLDYVAPIGERESYVQTALTWIKPYI